MRKTVTAALALALAPALARAEQKIGYVDFQRALSEVDEGKAAFAVLKRDKDEKQRQLDGKRSELDKLQADFEKQAVVMSEEARKEKGQDLDRRIRELQALFMSSQKDLADREREATRAIGDKLSQVVHEIAEADGFTMVLERSSCVVYAPASLDLTNELVRKYNVRFPPGAQKKGDAAAAGKKPEPAAKKAEGAPAKKK